MPSRRSSQASGRASAQSTPQTPQTSTTSLSQGDYVSNEAAGRSLKDKYQLAVSNVPRQVDFTTIRQAFEKVLRPRSGPNQYRPIHFTLQLDPPDPRRIRDKNRGTGVIYLNDEKFAKFLAARVNEVRGMLLHPALGLTQPSSIRSRLGTMRFSSKSKMAPLHALFKHPTVAPLSLGRRFSARKKTRKHWVTKCESLRFSLELKGVIERASLSNGRAITTRAQ